VHQQRLEVKSYFKKSKKFKNLKEDLEKYKDPVDARYLLESLGFKITLHF
jgi:hypothetical protein